MQFHILDQQNVSQEIKLNIITQAYAAILHVNVHQPINQLKSSTDVFHLYHNTV